MNAETRTAQAEMDAEDAEVLKRIEAGRPANTGPAAAPKKGTPAAKPASKTKPAPKGTKGK